MKKILIFFISMMFVLTSANASDNFETESNTKKWHTTLKLIDINIILKSINYISENEISTFKIIYAEVKTKFFEYIKIDPAVCKNEQLEIRIVTEQILDNRKYFPNEDTYAGIDTIIFGRYFQQNNILYIVPMNFERYYWKNNIAHELIHYFRDDCGISTSIYNEHEFIKKITNKYFPEE